MQEYIIGGLAVLVALMGGLAWIYRRGKAKGIDEACGIRIENKIDAVGKRVDDNRKHDDMIHGKLFDKVDEVKNLVIQHLDK